MKKIETGEDFPEGSATRERFSQAGLGPVLLKRHLYRIEAVSDKGERSLLYPADQLIEALWARRIAGVVIVDSTLGVFLPTRASDRAPTLIKGGLHTRRRPWEPEHDPGLDYSRDETPRAAAIREFKEETGYTDRPILEKKPPVTFLYRALWDFGYPQPGTWPHWGWVNFFHGTVKDTCRLEHCIPEVGLLPGRWYNPVEREDDRKAIQEMRWWQRSLLLEVGGLNLPWSVEHAI